MPFRAGRASWMDWHRSQRAGWDSLGLKGVAGAVYLYLYAPLLGLLFLSLTAAPTADFEAGFVGAWYVKVLRSPAFLAAIQTSLRVALSATLIALLLGTAAALALGKHRFRGQAWIEWLFYLPVAAPEVVLGFASVTLLAQLGRPLGFWSVLVVHVAFCIPCVVFIVRARLASFDERWHEAALDLGATPVAAFWHVTLPWLLPALVGSGLLCFALSLDDCIVTSFVAGDGVTTLPVLLYSKMKTGVSPEINAAASLLLILTVVLVGLAQLVQRLQRLPQWIRIVLGATCLGLVTLAVGPTPQGGTVTTLHLYIWSNYTSEKLLRDFETRYRCRVIVETYDSNEALLAKLQTGVARYDLVVPSDYMVGVLIRQGLLRPINRSRLTNWHYLDPAFLHASYDPENCYAVPYTFVITGIGYRRDKVLTPVESWEVLWDARYQGRIALLDDVRECFAAALRRRGASPNSRDEGEIARAADDLIAQKPLVKTYDSATFEQLLLYGEAWLVHGFNGQIAKAAYQNPNIAFVVPKEGGTCAVDCLAIPVNAAHPELAEQFINYVLEPQASAEIVQVTGYGTPNRAVRDILPPAWADNPYIFPPEAVLRRCTMIEDVGAILPQYDYYWAVIKSK
ncbi:MAG: extracellular solute-binding protein [Acidobacteriota bacterium]